MKIKIILSMTTVIIVTLATLISGCSSDRWEEVNGGNYIPENTGGAHDSLAASVVKGMTVDRENNTIRLLLENGSMINISFTVRSRQDWPAGCPANLGSTRMEVLDLDIVELTINSAVFINPVLVRNCPPSPEKVLLREDGQIGGSSTACVGNNKCIHFKPHQSGPATLHQEQITVGRITDVQGSSTSDTSGRILVELEQSDGTCDKYWVGIKADTMINDYREGTYDIATFTDFKPGQQVKVWFGGPVRESYPAQVEAKRIDIINNNDGFA